MNTKCKEMEELYKNVEARGRQRPPVSLLEARNNLYFFVKENKMWSHLFSMVNGIEACCGEIDLTEIRAGSSGRSMDGTRWHASAVSWCRNCGSMVKKGYDNKTVVIKPKKQ